MSTDSVSVKFMCTKCGETSLELPDDYTDDSVATCKQCGVEVGRWGDIKAKAMDAVRDHAKTAMRNAFKGIKGIKFK